MNCLTKHFAAALALGCLLLASCNDPGSTNPTQAGGSGSGASGSSPDTVAVEYMSWADMEQLAQAGGKVTIIDVWASY